jgi:hypothetical protein
MEERELSKFCPIVPSPPLVEERVRERRLAKHDIFCNHVIIPGSYYM